MVEHRQNIYLDIFPYQGRLQFSCRNPENDCWARVSLSLFNCKIAYGSDGHWFCLLTPDFN